MTIFWPGLISMAVLYAAIFAVGVFASRRGTKATDEGKSGQLAEVMLAGRSLPLWIAFLTMTATWVGGGYINGTAEYTYSSGILWGAQAGLGYALSLILGGLFFARTMRRHGFATLVDPLEARYGRVTGAILMVPAVLAELLWSAAILVALGTTVGTVLGLDLTTSIVVSSAVAIGYTVSGGMRSVAYTDVLQLGLIALGLGIAIPFAISTAGGLEALGGVMSTPPPAESGEVAARGAGALAWFGSAKEGIYWTDFFILLALGGIPWNVYFQRVLSSRDEGVAAKQSIAAGFMCMAMAAPAVVLGLCGRAIDWPSLEGGVEAATALDANKALVLPMILRYAVPMWVAIIGLGAISAAVMSSVDSSILSAASLVSWNGYRRLFAPETGARAMARLVRALVVVLGSVATVIALTVGSIKELWYLCGDVVYVALFPHLALALFDQKANRIGALSGLGVAVFLRLGGGDETLGLPAFLPYPDWSDAGGVFPFRTTSMLAGLLVAIVVSRLTARLDPPRPLQAAASIDAIGDAVGEEEPTG